MYDLWICEFVDLWICGFVDLWICGFVDFRVINRLSQHITQSLQKI